MGLYKTEQNITINSRLQPFISSLQIFIHRYEEIIVKISDTLPGIEKQIEDNILEARELLHFLFHSSSDEQLFGVKQEIKNFHEQLEKILSDLEETNLMDKNILNDLKTSIEISNTTSDEIKSIFDISENLKVYAINSIANSRKAGDRGRGYQVISSEFIKHSESIALGTKEISSIGDLVQKDIQDFLFAVQELEEYSNINIKTISTSSGDILSKANSSIENFSEILHDLLNRVECSKNPTYQIMVELQQHDIIHQQLVHLIENIDDIMIILDNNSDRLDLAEHSMTEYDKAENRSLYTLLIFLIENTEHQMNRISGDFIVMINNLERLFQEMNNTINDVNTDKNEFSQIVVDSKTEPLDCQLQSNTSRPSVLNYIFDSPCVVIREMRDNIDSLKKKKRSILELFFKLEKQINNKRIHAQSFLPVIEVINNLFFLSRIEQARYNLKFSIAGAGMDDNFFEDTFSELSNIIEAIGYSHDLVIKNFHKTRDSFNIQENKYDEMEKCFIESLRALNETKKIFLKHFNTVMEITNELLSEISGYTVVFEELRALNDDIGRNIAICAEIKGTISLRINILGGALSLNECDFKDVIYQKIVQKCTVAQELETIKENFQGFEIEEAGSNSITLF
ncbi:MAG: hypothetical protein JEZ04_09785 [Spirochaetales bacterium]|nr:hypothetical protein [Spirochaetales bacterium]